MYRAGVLSYQVALEMAALLISPISTLPLTSTPFRYCLIISKTFLCLYFLYASFPSITSLVKTIILHDQNKCNCFLVNVNNVTDMTPRSPANESLMVHSLHETRSICSVSFAFESIYAFSSCLRVHVSLP